MSGLVALSEAIRRKEVSSSAVVSKALETIEEEDSSLGAFVSLCGDALEEAGRADRDAARGEWRGPLHGVPVAVKDIVNVKGARTTASSRAWSGEVAPVDAVCVRRLREAGAIIVGKTQTHEFALGTITPTTRNPWDESRICGGSSGGSAVAVASGMCVAAVGSDTGGSVRTPASLCGVVGLKPTWGTVSGAGVIPLSWSLDHVGVLAATAYDALLVLGTMLEDPVRGARLVRQAVEGDSLPPERECLKGVRIGVPSNYFFDRVDPGVRDATLGFVEVLAERGASVAECEAPLSELYMATEFGILLPEAAAYHGRRLRERAEAFGLDVRVELGVGQRIPAHYYVAALQARSAIRNGWRAVFVEGGLDVVIVPATPMPAIKAGREWVEWSGAGRERVGESFVRLVCPANLTGQPAISVPAGLSSGALPLGVQLVGRPRDEETLVKVATAGLRELGLACVARATERWRG